MKPIAIISDVHANLPALEATLARIDSDGIDEIWCLGDITGRGPHPEECARLVRARCALVLAGNHDRVVCGREPVQYLGASGAIARWSNLVMGEGTLRWLAGLGCAARRGDIQLYHGGPEDPAWQFISDRADAAAVLSVTDARLVVVGHTHQPAIFRARDGALKNTAIRHRADVRLDRCRAVLNPGAVGAPAGSRARGSFLVLDPERMRAQWHQVAYDPERFITGMQEAGFGSWVARLAGAPT